MSGPKHWRNASATQPTCPSNHRWGITVGNIASQTLTLLAADPGGGNMLQSILLIWVPIGFLFWFLLIRPQQQEKKQRQAMLDTVKRNDRVITVGGIYGVVTEVDREHDQVTVRVDDTAKVKLRVTVGSIARIQRDGS
ncbi:MAG: preprotein translocase subunit YajC [Planctomycetota bacterium]